MDIMIVLHHQISMTPRSFPGVLEFIGDHFAFVLLTTKESCFFNGGNGMDCLDFNENYG
jgi:hypothetical protein